MKVLVTGGCGYIGSHTIVDLLDHGFDVVCADNLSRSRPGIMDRVEQITGKTVKLYEVDLCEYSRVKQIFIEQPEIAGIIHFAAYKSVPESVEKPLMYYDNNLRSLINVLRCTEEFEVPSFVFSSSCSVYGNAEKLPVTEQTPLQPAMSPYAHTKQIGEEIIQNVTKSSPQQYILLRYFNPVGAHESALIGEWPSGAPENLVPIITETAIGKREKMYIFGEDWNTRDGTCVRDYIHVMDIANAHTKALQYLLAKKNRDNCEIFNLGTGNGVTVLEAVTAFERVTGQKLNYNITGRRPGDVEAVFANNNKARVQLGWEPQRDLYEMMSTAWEWEKQLSTKKP